MEAGARVARGLAVVEMGNRRRDELGSEAYWFMYSRIRLNAHYKSVYTVHRTIIISQVLLQIVFY